ncbi:Negative elongation factor C/D [Irineochytrium annulatum]|nr:Negative elongation factor C/D [Irineochytrium annulatum]
MVDVDKIVQALGSVATSSDGSFASEPLGAAASSESTYLYAQALLLRLRKETHEGKKTGYILQRIAGELDAMLGPLSNAYVRNFVKEIWLNSWEKEYAVYRCCAVFGDTAYKFGRERVQGMPGDGACLGYQQKVLLGEVFGNVAPNMIDQKIFLLAYASCVIERDGGDVHTGNMGEITDMLQSLRGQLSRLTPAMDLSDVFMSLLDATRYPLPSMALLDWISKAIRDPSFYESNALLSETELPLLFELLDERGDVMRALYEVVQRMFDSLSPTQAIEIKKKYIDRLVFLVKLGYALPVIKHLNGIVSRIDETLVAYFVNEILAVAAPPYPAELVAAMLQLVHDIPNGVNSSLVSEFISEPVVFDNVPH